MPFRFVPWGPRTIPSRSYSGTVLSSSAKGGFHQRDVDDLAEAAAGSRRASRAQRGCPARRTSPPASRRARCACAAAPRRGSR